MSGMELLQEAVVGLSIPMANFQRSDSEPCTDAACIGGRRKRR